MASQNIITNPQGTSKFKKVLYTILLVILLIGFLLFWWNYLFVFGEGVKSGQLNYIVKKGNIFKTYEGKLIQSGIRSQQAGSIQSYEFEFSVADDSLANELMSNSGNFYDLHYKEYKHALPWRGFSPFVVDKIVRMQPAAH
jgi:hypothetical protein